MLEADRKRVGLRLVVGRDAHPVVFSDAIRLRQILLNVVGNAIKYTEAGRVVVRLGRTANPAAATVEVRDTGVGVARGSPPPVRAVLARPRHRPSVPGARPRPGAVTRPGPRPGRRPDADPQRARPG